ncbi:unnamed protein product [Auanema sp. JU1783]|nr:unnamed protein product [Auanema sp. JU1783]
MEIRLLLLFLLSVTSVKANLIRNSSHCTANLCEFGTCVIDSSSQKGYRCDCDEKFQGEHCNFDVNECEQAQCVNGNCINLFPKNVKDWGYKCDCPPGFTGQKCDYIDSCGTLNDEAQRCYNGVCQDGFCACSDGWAGRQCNHAVPSRKYFSRCSLSGSVVDFCISSYSDGKCDVECAREECFYDGMDCIYKESKNGAKKEKCFDYDFCNLNFANGVCDPACNTPQCGFDGGDCEKSDNLLDPQLLAITIITTSESINKTIRDLQITIARLLLSPFVRVATDSRGEMIYEWKSTERSGSLTLDDIGNRINIRSNDDVSNNTNRLVVFFDIASNDCSMRKEKIENVLNSTLNTANCFDSVKTASRYLKNELVRKPESLELLGKSVRITDVQVYRGQAPSWRHRIYWFVFGLLCAALVYIALYTVIVHIKKQKRKKECFAPIWKIPKQSPVFKNENFTSFSPPSLYEATPIKKECSPFPSTTFKNVDETHLLIDEEPVLIRAVRRCDIEAVSKMITSVDTIIDSVDSQGLGVLHHAIGNNDSNMLKLLLDSGEFDVFETNGQGQIPLVYAAKIGHPQLDCYALLIHAMEKRRFNSESSGCDSSDSAYGSSRRTLLPLSGEFGAAWSLCDDYGRNAVHYAALNNLHNLIHYLVAYGSNPSIRDGKGDTPLHLASKHGHLDSVRTLLSCNADLSIVDGDDLTPFQIAMRYGHWDVLHYLKSGRITYTPVSRSRRIKRPRVISSFVSESDSEYNSFDKEENMKRSRQLVIPLSTKPSVSRGPPLLNLNEDINHASMLYNLSVDSQISDIKSVCNPFILTPPAQLLGFETSSCRSNTLPSCASSPNYYYDGCESSMYAALDTGEGWSESACLMFPS